MGRDRLLVLWKRRRLRELESDVRFGRVVSFSADSWNSGMREMLWQVRVRVLMLLVVMLMWMRKMEGVQREGLLGRRVGRVGTSRGIED